MDELLRGLRELQDQAVHLRGALTAMAADAPQGVTAADRAGAAEVDLGPDGQLEAVRVAPDWEHKLGRSELGDAVLEAFRVAAAQRLQMVHDGARGAGAVEVPQCRLPLVDLPAEPASPHRSFDSLVEDVLSALDDVESLTAVAVSSVLGAGTSDQGRVAVTLSQSGLVSCEVDGRWAAGRSGQELTVSLERARAMAQSELERAAAAPGPGSHLDELFVGAMAFLNDPQRMTDSGKDVGR